MFATLAQLSINIPGTESPWFFWYIPFGLALACLAVCFVGAITAAKVSDKKKTPDGLVAIAVISGIIGVSTMIYSGVVFFRIFESVIPQVTTVLPCTCGG